MSWNIFGSVCGEADHDLRYAGEVSQFPISGNPIRLAKDKTKNFNLWKMRDLNHIWATQLSCTEGYPLTCGVCKWRFSWSWVGIRSFKNFMWWNYYRKFAWLINEKEKTAVLFNYIVGVKRPTFFWRCVSRCVILRCSFTKDIWIWAFILLGSRTNKFIKWGLWVKLWLHYSAFF